jgi:uncharacterized protein (TIGR00369 family)
MAVETEDSLRQRQRERLVTWQAPDPGAHLGMSGTEYLSALASGDVPNLPFGALMRIQAADVSAGRVVFTCEPDESMYNAIGLVHGGVVSMLVDTVASAAVWVTLPTGKYVVSIEMKVNYLRSVHPTDGQLIATGKAVKVGSRIGFAEASVTNGAGHLVATGSSTVVIVEA